MNPTASRVFFYSPALAVRGIRLSTLVEQYRRSQCLPPLEIEAYQGRKFQRLVAACRSRVHALRELDQRLVEESATDPEIILSRMPMMDRENYYHSVDFDLSPWHRAFLPSDTSSGTTGKAFKVWKNPSAWGRELAATWRAYSWFGVRMGDPQARFWGIPLSPVKRFKAQMTDLVCNRVRHPDTRLEAAQFASFFETLVRFRPKYYYGIPSLISRFAQWVLESGRTPPPSAGVVTTGEALRPGQREAIEEAFCARVYDEYGCGEMGSIAHQCGAGRYHIMAENLILRVVREGRLCRAGEEGKILLTHLDNTVMPLINYDTGDVGVLAEGPCGCGITLPVLERLEGRVMDYLVNTERRDMSPVFVYYLFAHQSLTGGVKEWQLNQYEDGSVVMKIVPGPSWGDFVRQRIEEELKKHMGQGLRLEFQLQEIIPRTPSGKVQQVVRLPGTPPEAPSLNRAGKEAP